ncbi:PKD domain-containing protein [Shewanella sp. 10N.286.54.B9]|uniref:PKD domain-containing protein n=1 Tax=Shewanella sp. 10N.286.54.B9 TaxID=3229719 RepID=UPI00354C292F
MLSNNQLILLSILALTACGGSSDNADSDLIPPPITDQLVRCEVQSNLLQESSSSNIIFHIEPSYHSLQPAVIAATVNGAESSNYTFSWSQKSGDALVLKSTNSPMLAFTASTSGSYQFELIATGENNSYSAIATIDVIDGQTNQLAIRVDHQVTMGSGVSFRIDTPPSATPENISWCLAAGPNINVDLSNLENPLFTAPNVDQDTFAILRASATINGQQSSDDVHILITKEAPITSPYFDSPIARTFSYQPNSPYKSILRDCVYSNQLQQSCTIEQLPLIGQESNSGKQQILDRLLVSHQWMGENFEYFLDNLDADSDFATLLQSVTAIVISYDVRPSFYWVATGAIYLDPNDLWLLAEERDTINEAPDYRSGFGNELQFLMPWRYVKNNQYTSYVTPRSTRINRTPAEMQPDLASLLYHELAHANDFFPRSIHLALQGPTLLDDYETRNSQQLLVSDQLTAKYPLNSAEMASLANVSFRGESATAQQKSYMPSDISSFFSTDTASDYYAFSTRREDAAMLFEEAMMSHRLGIQRDVGVTDKPDAVSADTITVDWGQRGRVGDDSLQNRAAFVISEIFPELDATTLVKNLPQPIPMAQGATWSENLVISPALKNSVNRVAFTVPANTPAVTLSGSRHQLPVD